GDEADAQLHRPRIERPAPCRSAARGPPVSRYALAGAFVFLRWLSLMKRSVSSRASSSRICFGGDFIRYELGASSAPAMPLFRASLAVRTASMTIPAELGESHTSSFSSQFSGTSPNAVPSMRMYAHLRSVSHGT